MNERQRRLPVERRRKYPDGPSDIGEISREADERVRRFLEQYRAEREEERRRALERRTADVTPRSIGEASA
jgi:hypothetical protein